MIKSAKFFFLILMTLGLIFSCQKERPHPSWDVEMLIPLVSDTVTVSDLINDTLYIENPDHSLSFIFDQHLYDISVDTLVMLPDTIFYWNFNIPLPVTLDPGQVVFDFNYDHPLEVDYGVKFEWAHMHSGDIEIEVVNQAPGAIVVEYGINSALDLNNEPFFISGIVQPDEAKSERYDFSGYKVDFRGENYDTVNTMYSYIGISISPDEPAPVQVTPEDTFLIKVTFEDIVLEYAKGYFGHNTFSFGPETKEFNLFEDFEIGSFSIEDAKINLIIENYYGVDGLFRITDFIARNGNTGTSVPLQGDMLDSALFIERATQIGNGQHVILPTSNSFDFSNTNFIDMMEIMPDEFEYAVEVETNIFLDSISKNDFFYLDEPIRVSAEMIIDQGIRVEDLLLEKVIEWTNRDIDFDNIKKGQLAFVVRNGFPFSLNINLFLENKQGLVLDTLLYNDFIQSALLDENQKVTEPVESRIYLELTDPLEYSIKHADSVRYDLRINSAGTEYIKVYKDYNLQLKINGDFKLNIQQ
ncbi:MAG: hypothetical protein K8R53_04715 [Bacteroidales bacterium]|nr:hypothetical protein [Bacteroidales bacterium]